MPPSVSKPAPSGQQVRVKDIVALTAKSRGKRLPTVGGRARFSAKPASTGILVSPVDRAPRVVLRGEIAKVLALFNSTGSFITTKYQPISQNSSYVLGLIRYGARVVGKKRKPAKTPRWSDAEVDAAVEVYSQMLLLEGAGKKYNKAEFNLSLRAAQLSHRTKPSVEFRMRNISAVLEREGGTWIKGYRPAKNVGRLVAAQISFALARLSDDLQPEVPSPELAGKVARWRRRGVGPLPAGRERPGKRTVTVEQIERDPRVKAWVLENAGGKCELCGDPAPFAAADGYPFLEVHHVKFLADDGPDLVENAVALCPNCHRACHLAVDREALAAKLYARHARLAPPSAPAPPVVPAEVQSIQIPS